METTPGAAWRDILIYVLRMPANETRWTALVLQLVPRTRTFKTGTAFAGWHICQDHDPSMLPTNPLHS